ncbi:transmembrane protein, putative [Bodo saltans]|uniref:Transmembrane protein, putative n=1 Tax=Bodo saltans TaxID=75058 RepID=A0A0S4J5H9_BODSA|nr:transmembrane protein, putative [Bodo saltans]|eukprot:CUG84256.1 transmembrane protein, putative [Bodo saltans]
MTSQDDSTRSVVDSSEPPRQPSAANPQVEEDGVAVTAPAPPLPTLVNDVGSSDDEGYDEDNNDSQSEEEEVAVVVRWFLVEAKDSQKADRLPSVDFIENAGLVHIMNELERSEQQDRANEAHEDVKGKRWRRCDCQFPHDIMACNLLHAKDETIRISKVDTVRIAAALPNPGLDTLLRVPKGRHMWCTTKKEHDPATCKFLHRHPQAVPIGRDRLGYLPEELVDNQAYRHLVTHPEHVGKWCTNVLKHEAKTCLFMHRAAKGGQALGKRNLNVSKDGRLVKSANAFERKKRSGRVLAAPGTEVPEFVRKQRELEELVNRINDETEDAEEEQSNSAPPTEGSSPAVGTDDALHHHQATGGRVEGGKKNRTKRGLLAELQTLHPAMLAMIGAFVLAVVVQLLPSGTSA